jgi:hypothetical protein
MMPYLPDLHNLVDLAVTWAIGAVLLLTGTGLLGRRLPPEIRIVAGWGLLCLTLTLWGTATPWSLAIPAAAFGAVGVAALAIPARRPDRADGLALGRMLALSLPFWLVMAPIRPAEPDTWLNLLPNAVYLVDHGVLPAAGRPDAHSFLPAAPYNTQFLAYLGGLAEPDYPAGGMLLAGMLVARTLAPPRPGDPPGWSALALGLLLATALDPGFVPRVHLAAYGETGLAVTALMAGWLVCTGLGHASGLPPPPFKGGRAVPAVQRWTESDRDRPILLAGTALVLAAMVEIKQSGFGLVAAVIASGLTVLVAERGRPSLRALAVSLVAAVPALVLFVVWRAHVAVAGVDELRPLPLALWQWANLPAILAAIGRTIAAKGLYFACVALAIGAVPLVLRRIGWRFASRFLVFHAALSVWYFLFLLLTYIGHFPGAWSTEAHSFYRYETHLMLVLVLALALAIREAGWLAAVPQLLAPTAIYLALVAPVGAAPLLRFDMVMPQPLVWDLARHLVPWLHEGDRLALVLPGDNGSVATMMGGVLNDTAPAVKSLDIVAHDRADDATLAGLAAAGYTLAFISCTPDGLDGFPPGVAVLARWTDGAWLRIADWSYPAVEARSRWQHILSWRPLCRAE